MMTAAQKLNLISVEDYLTGELESPIKHEYLGGVVHAISGARVTHNTIATNVIGSLHSRLKGRTCRPFNSDMKIRVRLPTHWRFYYPDASVICRSNPPDYSYQDEPAVIFEVLSKATRRIDGSEKKDAYLTIPSLSAYILLEQDTATAIVYRRTEQGFVPEVYTSLAATIPLPEIDIELPLAEIYDGVEFLPERDEADDIG